MKLTVAVLALLLAGASYADMAAAKCWHGDKAQTKCEEYVAKHRGSKCEGKGKGTPEYCAIPKPNPSPSPSPDPLKPVIKVEELPLYKATHKQFGLGSCQYKTKHDVNHSAKCTGVDKHEGGLEIEVQYQAKNLDNLEKVQEQIHFHGKAKGDGNPGQPLQVNGGGGVKFQMKKDSVKGTGKETVVRDTGSTGGSKKGRKEKVTYECSGGKTGIKCGWSDK